MSVHARVMVETQPLLLRSDAPVTDHALLGDGRSVALVSSEGCIDWWCPERFDAPSVFGRLLDPDAGHFTVGLPVRHLWGSRYVEGTNVHQARLWTADAEVVVTTAMPHQASGTAPGRIVRLVECRRGEVDVRMELAPRFDYGRERVRAWPVDGGVQFRSGGGGLALSSSWPLETDGDAVAATRRMRAGDADAFVLDWRADGDPPAVADPVAVARDAVAAQVDFWRAWSGRCTHDGPYRDAVVRSLLALKLLQHHDSGAFVAAATTSVSEWHGGPRTWDYRHAWLRDGVFIVMAFESTGYAEESDAFRRWLASILRRDACDRLQMLYRVDGDRDLRETELPHLAGHRDSRPVRVGNEAAEQHQLDTFGEAMMCFHRTRHVFEGEHRDGTWHAVRAVVDWVAERWRGPDSGLWEHRGKHSDYVYSKAAAWLALDHGIDIATQNGFGADLDAWRRARDDVRAMLDEDGFDRSVGSFVQTVGRRDADAAMLLLPILGIVDADDPRMASTVAFLQQRLVQDDLVYRYDSDDRLPGSEGAFLPAGFWLSHVLALQGRVGDARRVFERTLRVAGTVGLLPEEADPSTGEPLGNYPQALSHLALVNAALAIQAAQ